jgi:hypothetical protein
LVDTDTYQVRGILRDVILSVYEEEKPEMDGLPHEFTEDANFPLERFRQIYLDSLLLKREDVRTYCRKNQIRQVCEVKGLLWEDVPSLPSQPVIEEHSPQQFSVEPVIFPASVEKMADNQHVAQALDTPLTVKKRVASVDNSVRGKHTRQENPVALAWVVWWRSQKWSEKDIANALFAAGAANSVIGYLLALESEDLSKIDNDAARKRGQRARNGAMELGARITP